VVAEVAELQATALQVPPLQRADLRRRALSEVVEAEQQVDVAAVVAAIRKAELRFAVRARILRSLPASRKST